VTFIQWSRSSIRAAEDISLGTDAEDVRSVTLPPLLSRWLLHVCEEILLYFFAPCFNAAVMQHKLETKLETQSTI
jgi:hypothetical protein